MHFGRWVEAPYIHVEGTKILVREPRSIAESCLAVIAKAERPLSASHFPGRNRGLRVSTQTEMVGSQGVI